jgi:hypothetical protein
MREAEQPVWDEVRYCVSCLIQYLAPVAERLGDYDTYLNLVGGRPDYEEAARAFVMDDADLDQLEEIADNFGYWSDILADVGYEKYVEGFADPDDEAMELEEWLAACFQDGVQILRSKVWALIDDYLAVCDDYNLEPEYLEICEYWLVTNWLAGELREHGEVVEDYLGLTIWGRCTTGQPVYMDAVVQDIVRKLNRA